MSGTTLRSPYYTAKHSSHVMVINQLMTAVGAGWVGHCSTFLHKWAEKTLLSPCSGFISDILGSFQSGGAFSGQFLVKVFEIVHTSRCLYLPNTHKYIQ